MSFGFGFSLPAYLGAGGAFAGASLNLDFTSGNNTLDPRITFTRSTTATFTGSNGLIQTAAINAPRFDYDPVTLAPKGLLIEEQRMNLLLNTSILETQDVTVTAAAHTLSFYGTGTIVLSGAFVGTVTGTGAYPTRTTLTFTPTVGVLTVTVTGSVISAQLEAGAFATSYIPTVASQVTRAADIAVMTGTNFSSWYNATEGSIYAQADSVRPTNLSPATRVFQFDDGTAGNNIRSGSAATLQVINATVVQANLTPLPAIPFNGTVFNFASAYKLNDFASSTGGAVSTDTSGTVPSVNQFSLGGGSGAGILNGHIQRIAYYNRRLANTELTAITS
jgi:hypothetical protein